MQTTKRALVLGATGGIGGETAAALMRHGWAITAMARNPANRPAALAAADWVKGDAMNPEDVRRAAEGADVIVHAVNPPAYRGWSRLVLPMIDSSIAAAKDTGARLVLPGTIYNYGTDAFPDLAEDAPQTPASEKGRIRVELERRMEAASREGVPVLIVRFGDFFGPEAGNNWFGQGLVTPGKRMDAITYPGRRGVGHAWAYLPDAAETIARLLNRAEALGPFARFHFEGVWDAEGRTMTDAIRRALNRPEMKVRALPWALIGLAGLANETLRELYRMRYLWRTPVRLDNRRLVAFLGEEPRTPLSQAVATTLAGLKVS